ncbi:MAG TPA: VOC family protein [Bryobacteraceae bacterium]|jgi:methylmalonyl-CoA/ethylmalonyl-CoA epimerase|nr:VOC family protein [Bryobacteraceae bacterium]
MPETPEHEPLGFPMRLHHVGYVVGNMEASIRGFMHSLGMTWDGQIFHDPTQRVRVTFLATGPNCAQIELVEPAGENSPVAVFLKTRGGGQHHLCYEVGDIEHALDVFKSRKAAIVQRPCPAVAFDGRRIAWFITREKLVVELLETGKRPAGNEH